MADFTLSDAIKEAAMKEGVPVNEVNLVTTAVVNIAPEQDERVVAFQNEVKNLLSFAQTRVIVTDHDVTFATNDLAVMSQLTKSLEAKREEYVKPLNGHIKTINSVFKSISEPLSQADKLTRDKVLAYRAEIERKRREIEEINRQAEELARKQAALNNGEFTVDTTPIVAPVVPAHVRTDAGTLGTAVIAKWELEDINQVPREYLMVNSTLIGNVVRASKGNLKIAGIRIWTEPILKITTK